MLGRTMVGERCLDGKVALDFLATMENPVSGDIGITGNSGGGTTTLWLSAIDERLAVGRAGMLLLQLQGVDHGYPALRMQLCARVRRPA